MIKPALKDDAFIADVWSAAGDREHLHLWWLGQSGFLVQSQGRHLLIDPYLSDSLTAKYASSKMPHVRISERVVDPVKLNFVDLVTSSHSHTDHLDAETLRAINGLRLLAPEAARDVANERSGGAVAFTINDGQSVEIDRVTVHAVRSQHGDLPALGYVLRLDDRTIYHSGDTVVYDGLADRLRPFEIDIAILPINGQLGNMNGRDAARLAHAAGAKLVIPCHYDMFEFNTADPREQFIPECERLGQPCRVLKLGQRFTFP